MVCEVVKPLLGSVLASIPRTSCNRSTFLFSYICISAKNNTQGNTLSSLQLGCVDFQQAQIIFLWKKVFKLLNNQTRNIKEKKIIKSENIYTALVILRRIHTAQDRNTVSNITFKNSSKHQCRNTKISHTCLEIIHVTARSLLYCKIIILQASCNMKPVL